MPRKNSKPATQRRQMPKRSPAASRISGQPAPKYTPPPKKGKK